MDKYKVAEIEKKIAELKALWPPHYASPLMWHKLEELEAQFEAAKKAKAEC